MELVSDLLRSGLVNLTRVEECFNSVDCSVTDLLSTDSVVEILSNSYVLTTLGAGIVTAVVLKTCLFNKNPNTVSGAISIIEGKRKNELMKERFGSFVVSSVDRISGLLGSQGLVEKEVVEEKKLEEVVEEKKLEEVVKKKEQKAEALQPQLPSTPSVMLHTILNDVVAKEESMTNNHEVEEDPNASFEEMKASNENIIQYHEQILTALRNICGSDKNLDDIESSIKSPNTSEMACKLLNRWVKDNMEALEKHYRQDEVL